jgi:hypothetical protein
MIFSRSRSRWLIAIRSPHHKDREHSCLPKNGHYYLPMTDQNRRVFDSRDVLAGLFIDKPGRVPAGPASPYWLGFRNGIEYDVLAAGTRREPLAMRRRHRKHSV